MARQTQFCSWNNPSILLQLKEHDLGITYYQLYFPARADILDFAVLTALSSQTVETLRNLTPTVLLTLRGPFQSKETADFFVYKEAD